MPILSTNPALTRTVQPICPFFYQCGGCDTQDVAYSDQVAFKQFELEKLFSTLVTSQTVWHPFLNSQEKYPRYYRNKIRFGFLEREGKILPSRHAKGEHDADIPIDRCFLASPEADQIMNATASFATEQAWKVYNSDSNSGWLKHLLIREGKFTGQILISLVTTQHAIPQQDQWLKLIQENLPKVVSIYQTQTSGKNNELSQDYLLWGKTRIEEKVGEYTFIISPHAFFQTNSLMLETLYTTISQRARPQSKDILWDLYAGSATIGIFLSPKLKQVISLENNQQNKADAEWNIQHNQIENLQFWGESVDRLTSNSFLRSLPSASIIVVDPPRAGISAKLRQILPHLTPHRLIYISCNPLTAQRDCQELIRNGYRLESVQGIDMFPHTHHCEVIIELILPK